VLAHSASAARDSSVRQVRPRWQRGLASWLVPGFSIWHDHRSWCLPT
jgi:hypothetical protein